MTLHRPTVLRSTAALALVLALGGCEAGPKAIRYGQDECVECKMTLVDQHYGAELITAKGKVLKFDDVSCLLGFQGRESSRTGPAAQLVVIEFNRPNTFLPVERAVFLRHDRLRTPMGSSLAAFSTEAALEAVRSQLGGGGSILRWSQVVGSP